MKINKKLVSPVLMWAIILAGLFVVFQLVPARLVWPRNVLTSFLIVPALGWWLYFFLGAISVHRKAPLSADKIDRLVVEGVYGKVRHPIYSADIVLGWSLFFFYPDVRFLIGAHLAMFVFLFWIRLEEKALIEKFGDEYSEYKRKVPKLFPKIKSK
ncbi:MAG: hypothetical protein ACD_8C00124G0002 [uncultured bacterium]|nr:MAG: hypothetical protein ACD_8C00124G0002 [uncultured bacterium]